MPKKLAIDWDESELRLVAAQCNGASVKVIDAAVIPLEGGDVSQVLAAALKRRGLEKVDTLVAIGRDKAELRDLQLPPVPDDELPAMVRFQAIRSFASAGDSATVDFLVTKRTDRGVEMIAAAIAPTKLEAVREPCTQANLVVRRIALRPLGAAALYLTRGDHSEDIASDVVLIDLLAGDAEIVIVRGDRVVFLRTVKLPSNPASRPAVLAGELRRSLVASGASGAPSRVILWGRESVHRDEVAKIAEATGSSVRTVNPFDLVEVDSKIAADLPEHCGRLAPLVGLLAVDEEAGDRLIDFLNPRRRVEQKPNPLKSVVLIGAPIAAVLLLSFLVYRQLATLDNQIQTLKSSIASLEPQVKLARASVDRTERVDQFLDGDVNWLAEVQRLAKLMPPSDQLIIRSITGTADSRSGGGRLVLSGAVTDPAIIDQLEAAVRDEAHQIVGQGSSEQRSDDAYKWNFNETITVTPESIRNERYVGLAPRDESAAGTAVSDEPASVGPAKEEPASVEASEAKTTQDPEASTEPVATEDAS